MRAGKRESAKLSSIQSWQEPYRAALFETDPLKIPDRILKAEEVLIGRARELFSTPENLEERRAVDDAMYMLSALRDSLKSNRSDA